jgi:transposase
MVGFDGHKRIEGTKIHAAVAEGSLPVAVMISAGNIHEGTRLIPLMESISIETGRRQRKRPKTVYADTKYATPLNRFYLDKKHIRSQIPDPPTKTTKRPGRPRRSLDRETYHAVRYNVERFFAWLENYRKIMIRYERTPGMFLALIRIACIQTLWRVLK